MTERRVTKARNSVALVANSDIGRISTGHKKIGIFFLRHINSCCLSYLHVHYEGKIQNNIITVKPVLSGPVSIKWTPSIKRSVEKVPKIYPLNYSKCDVFKRSPLLSGRGHLLQSPSEGISIVFSCIKRSLTNKSSYCF